MKNIKLSVVLATRNEEANIAACLESVKGLIADLPAQAGEIIIFDENSTDGTQSIAKSFGAVVVDTKHEDNFHITKQKAIDKAKGEWILQLDADERVSKELRDEIKSVLDKSHQDFVASADFDTKSGISLEKRKKLFRKHEEIIRKREGTLGKSTGEICAYFIPRVNYFLGAPLLHAGVYPDAVIRLFKNGKARLPAKSVHELMEVDGEVAWLYNDLEHHESPTLSRYIARANRYTSLTAQEFKSKSKKNTTHLIYYSLVKPFYVFLNLYFRHRGYKDGLRGYLWSMFSAFHFPLAYWKYYVSK